MPSQFQTSRGTHRVQWSHAGKRFSRTFATKREADLHRLKLETGEVKAQHGASQTFSVFAEKWMEEYCKVRKAETQWAEDWSVIRIHLLPRFGDRRLSDLKKSDLLSLQRTLLAQNVQGKKKKLSPKTVNNIVALAKKMLGTAVDWELIAASPWISVRPIKSQDQDFDFWSPEERDQFIRLTALSHEAFARLVCVACHTGLRIGELAGLKRRDLDFQNRLVHVREQFSLKHKRRLTHTKGKTAGRVPMNAVVIAALSHARDFGPDEAVFDLTLFRNARRQLRTLCQRVGVKAIRFHDLRHTFASCLAMAGVDLMLIQKLMRHKSYIMTLRYAHLHPDQIKGATDVLHPECTRKQLSTTSETPQPLEPQWWAHLDLNQGPAGYEDVA